MKSNMGTADRVIRIIIAAVIGYLYYVGLLNGTVALILGALAVVFLATSFVRVCPLYLPFGLSTKQKS
jgi:hypothetical protein